MLGTIVKSFSQARSFLWGPLSGVDQGCGSLSRDSNFKEHRLSKSVSMKFLALWVSIDELNPFLFFNSVDQVLDRPTIFRLGFTQEILSLSSSSSTDYPWEAGGHGQAYSVGVICSQDSL